MTIKHTAEELGGCELTGLQSEHFPLPGVMGEAGSACCRVVRSANSLVRESSTLGVSDGR